MVVSSLFLALAHIASLTNYSDRKVAKIVVRHKIMSVRAEGYVSQQLSTPENPKGKFSCEWKRPSGLLAWLWRGWIDYAVVQHLSRSVTMSFLTNGVLVLAFLSFFVKSPYTCFYKFAYKLKIVTGLPWERFQILIFCMVITCYFPFLLLLRHYALLRKAIQGERTIF